MPKKPEPDEWITTSEAVELTGYHLNHLRRLIKDPGLRETLGRAGREYVEKYHSFESAQFMFGSIYANLFDGKSHDLIRLFHPVISPYVTSRPRPNHPLVENRLPNDDANRPAHLSALYP